MDDFFIPTGIQEMLSIETLGEAMRPENLRGEAFRLSREERDHIAGHALDSINTLAYRLGSLTDPDRLDATEDPSVCSRKIAALSNLLGDIGWEREGAGPKEGTAAGMHPPTWVLGELFPVAQLRPWLEEWQRQDNGALIEAERVAEIWILEDNREPSWEATLRQAIADAQTKLGTGAILLARIKKWMASHAN